MATESFIKEFSITKDNVSAVVKAITDPIKIELVQKHKVTYVSKDKIKDYFNKQALELVQGRSPHGGVD